MATSKKIKIDLVSVPFSGHLYPLLELVAPLLENEQYEIRLFTGMQKMTLAQDLGFSVIPLFPDEPNKMEMIANTQTQINAWGMYRQFKQNLELIPEVMTFLSEAFKKNQTDIVIADFVAVPAGIVSQQLGIPWITTIPTPFAIESQTTTPSYLGGWQPKDSFFGKSRDWIGRKVVRGFKKSVVWFLRDQLKPYQFKLYNQKQEETIYSPYAILGLGMEELEFRDDFPEQFQWIGPCCGSFETGNNLSCSERKTVLVTIGTHLLWGKSQLIKLVCDLASQYPAYDFLVTLGDNGRVSQQQIQDNVKVYSYLPYSEVLSQVDFVIHHGGAGILYNCIKYQVPALIIPHDYDQFDYAIRAELQGIAYVANRKKTHEIYKKFETVVKQERWLQLERLNLALRTYRPTEKLEAVIQRLVKDVK